MRWTTLINQKGEKLINHEKRRIPVAEICPFFFLRNAKKHETFVVIALCYLAKANTPY